ncbi:hypothetical protein Lfu02_18710 [Longispora fulva]|uniref:Uncharacterized protein n=1 Tax=Longispora fulva TaxID=619741 RepID=A0A8J7GLX9_9ACTN|nr:hypothetical protein [Longispora fulva]MBG6140125.1 hypothetical protein [Longispora fulva]GIG57499.1 hypothetical protein Lfu02_18710 [Longispora fulva]
MEKLAVALRDEDQEIRLDFLTRVWLHTVEGRSREEALDMVLDQDSQD